MSAISLAILNIAGAGDEIISSSTIYGGTYNLFANTLPSMELRRSLLNLMILKGLRKQLHQKQKPFMVKQLGILA